MQKFEKIITNYFKNKTIDSKNLSIEIFMVLSILRDEDLRQHEVSGVGEFLTNTILEALKVKYMKPAISINVAYRIKMIAKSVYREVEEPKIEDDLVIGKGGVSNRKYEVTLNSTEEQIDLSDMVGEEQLPDDEEYLKKLGVL